MSGFVGVCGPDVEFSFLEAMCASLRHRGPDEFEPETRNAEMSAGLSVEPMEKAKIADVRKTIAEGYLTKVDRAAMLAPLEVRAPFPDRAIVEFTMADILPEIKFTKEQDKILPQRLAARLLPTNVASKSKQGLTMPLDNWLKSGGADCLRDMVTESRKALFDRRAAKRLFDQQSKNCSNAGRIFILSMFSLWADTYGMTRG